jgi:hypothetical protein
MRRIAICGLSSSTTFPVLSHKRNEEVLLRLKEQRNVLHEISKRKANWSGHILYGNCLLRQVIKRKIKEGYKCQEGEEEDVGSYWMTLRKGEDTHI